MKTFCPHSWVWEPLGEPFGNPFAQLVLRGWFVCFHWLFRLNGNWACKLVDWKGKGREP